MSASLLVNLAHAEPIPILNFSGEINPGMNGTALSDPGVIGWQGGGPGAVLADGGTDYGNGRWRMSLNGGAETWQRTTHTLAAGDSFSLRFDAAWFTGSSSARGDGFQVEETLVGGSIRNGDFNAPAGPPGSRSFEQTPEWVNLGRTQGGEATATSLTFDGSRNAVLADSGQRKFALDTGHTLAAGDTFRVSFVWRDAARWNDARDRVAVTLYRTADDRVGGVPEVVETLQAPPSKRDASYETAVLDFAAIPAQAAGKRLFVRIEAVDGDGNPNGFARLDQFTLERGNFAPTGPVPRITAELHVEEGGRRVPVASRTFDFQTAKPGDWAHYHLAVPSGTLDAYAGKTLGLGFRAEGEASGPAASFDNVRLDTWAANAPEGGFAVNWDQYPDQVWLGADFWANRLQDWRLRKGRIECVTGRRDHLVVHRTGTSIRGNGRDFTLAVRTGLAAGTHSPTSRAGFLIGAGPNLDWRAALLVHDGLGRDFGIFAGMTGGGDLVIEDFSSSEPATLATSPAEGGFHADTRLILETRFDPGSGTYTLSLHGQDSQGKPIGSATCRLTSDRVLGSFGLLSHRGSSTARHWFDDFHGEGAALQSEPERHLAILGALHTLSKGTLRLTAQLPPLSLESNPTVALEILRETTWRRIAKAAVDNTDQLSSYTATFTVPDWEDDADIPYRLVLNVAGSDHTWSGVIRRDPVDKEELVIASTNCQRIHDGNMQNNGFDWTPAVLWHPHPQSYAHLAKHKPDVLLAHGDQIYEPQPTNKDTSGAVNRQLDFLYKWYLWVLQARDLAREIPTIVIPDDHDIYQGNLWGEGGSATRNESTGGYVEPPEWVRLSERAHTSHLPHPDPYNPTQPPPSIQQGIGVYFTGMTYGRLGFAILEDRKFKTGPTSPPPPPEQHLLGERQHAFLREWNKDWSGQDLKLVVSQSPLAALNTHAGPGYGFRMVDRDAHGWPTHRRNEAWKLFRASRMFQIAGDQHLATLAHHGTDAPRDAGVSFASPAMANFFPRIFDPMNPASGTTTKVMPYVGDYHFDGKGTLPDGVTPNLNSPFPHHFAILAAGNSEEYYQRSTGIHPPNYHDRGAGYGIVKINRKTRKITFGAWPIHADPEFPQTGGPFAGWPQTIRQTDNDGRKPAGHLPVIDTGDQENPVVIVHDEATGELIHAMRIRGNRYRPPVHDLTTTYRVEIAHGDGPVSQTLGGQTASPPGPPAIHFFGTAPLAPKAGSLTRLAWDVSDADTLRIEPTVGDVTGETIDGIGHVDIAPAADTTYTLTLNGTITARVTVRGSAPAGPSR